MTEEELSEQAFEWIKKNHQEVIDKFANAKDHIPDISPTTLFMAGSPGAGKTEVSKRLIENFKQKPIRIDADEIRAICPGYNGQNAHIFQRAATKGVHILYDHALKNNINVILDGTFAYSEALGNIQRSLNYNRKVGIFFIYQDPLQAWDFTKKREALEQRKVTKKVFINAFFKSKINANQAKTDFGPKIELNLIIKDFEKNLEQLELNVDNIDHYMGKVYTEDLLENLLT